MRACACAREEAHRLRSQAPQGELEHGRGGRVEPLHIVDGDDDGRRSREGAEDVEQSEADGALVGGLRAGVLEQQRDPEGVLARRPERRQRALVDTAEQVGKTRERDRRLSLNCTAGEDNSSSAARFIDTVVPEKRLAHAGLAGQQQRRRTPADALEETGDRAELGFACNHSTRHRPAPF